MRSTTTRTSNWGIGQAAGLGPYEDLDAFLHGAGDLALVTAV